MSATEVAEGNNPRPTNEGIPACATTIGMKGNSPLDRTGKPKTLGSRPASYKSWIYVFGKGLLIASKFGSVGYNNRELKSKT